MQNLPFPFVLQTSGKMDSSSRDTLLELFHEIIKWRRSTEGVDVSFNWTEFHLSFVLTYFLKLSLDCSLRVPKAYSSAKLLEREKNKKKKAISLTQKLKELFAVPKLLEGDSDTLKKNEVVAAFIDFLLQLLYDHHADLIIDPIQKELRFLLMVLGDAPFLCEEQQHEEDHINLLAEFEAVANEAGSLVHSLFFSTSEDPEFTTKDERFVVLLKQMQLLKGNIYSQLPKFSDLLPIIAKPNTTLKTSSLFIFDSLMYDLENLLNRDDPRIIGDAKDQIEALHQGLIFSQSLLKGIKFPPPQLEIQELKEHVTRITNVAFEAEYLINSFLAEDAPLSYFSIRLPHVLRKIKFIGTELQQQKQKNNCNFRALELANNFSSQLQLQAKRISEVDDTVVAFESRWVEDILDLLVGQTEHLQIISIVGMPGLGKTTFAKILYNDPLINDRFDKSSWCVVSQMYQRKSLLADILTSLLGKDNISNAEEESLALDVYQSLKGRRYFIVMDDIWDSKAWDDLRKCFPNDENGSRILFTTRNKDVAPPDSIISELPFLSNDQCWELLEKRVFNNKTCSSQSLEVVGKQIAANCHGLPLAVVVIAGILSSMDKEEIIWKEVGENISTSISCDGNNSMMQILELSYDHLQEYLKPCFLYFGAFPEDEEIPARKLMMLWIAEGFIPKGDRKRQEHLAEKYLMELIDRSLVMVAKRRLDGGVKDCVIHDLLRDLCLKICVEENFMRPVVDDKYTIYEKSHRLESIDRKYYLVQSSFGHHVRSFHCDGSSNYGWDSEPFFVGNMKLLRVLDFTLVGFGVRWIGVEYLVNLRHLVIHELPSMIGNLVNLEYLRVMGEYPKIPLVILKMDKLRYLCSNGENPFVFDEDCSSSQTNNIEVLKGVEIRNQKDAEMLKCSPHLRKLQCIFYVEEKGSNQYPDLLFFTHLQSLDMYGDYEGVVEINFPSNIKRLTLDGLRLTWEKMSIIGGLPNLQVLKLRWDAFIGQTWETKDGEFQQLTFLGLYHVGSLKQWNLASSEHFPKLQRLVLDDCPNLQEIPCEIGEIAALQSIEVARCARKSLAESARKIEQEQRDMGNEDFKLIFQL